jgi:hypothetical protein
MAEEKKGNLAMAGEFCREAAVLIFVFGNLDIWIKSLDGTWKLNFWPTVYSISKIFGVASLFQIVGMYFEKWRDK